MLDVSLSGGWLIQQPRGNTPAGSCSRRPCHPGKGKPCRRSNMLTPWEDELDDARPKRKPYARPARIYRVGALTYPGRKECGPPRLSLPQAARPLAGQARLRCRRPPEGGSHARQHHPYGGGAARAGGQEDPPQVAAPHRLSARAHPPGGPLHGQCPPALAGGLAAQPQCLPRFGSAALWQAQTPARHCTPCAV